MCHTCSGRKVMPSLIKICYLGQGVGIRQGEVGLHNQFQENHFCAYWQFNIRFSFFSCLTSILCLIQVVDFIPSLHNICRYTATILTASFKRQLYIPLFFYMSCMYFYVIQKSYAAGFLSNRLFSFTQTDYCATFLYLLRLQHSTTFCVLFSNNIRNFLQVFIFLLHISWTVSSGLNRFRIKSATKTHLRPCYSSCS
jgi:hypothetical protein